MRSLFLKIFAGFLVVTVVMASLIVTVAFQTFQRNYIETLTVTLRNVSFTLEPRLLPLLAAQRYEELDQMVKHTGKQISTRITVIAPNGEVLADSEEDPRRMENHRYRPEIDKALTSGSGQSTRYSTTVHERMLYLAGAMKEGGNVLAVLRVSLFLKDVDSVLSALRSKILMIVVVISAAVLIMAYVFSRSLSQPVRKLAAGANRVAGGDFEVHITLRNKDELGELANSFNTMTAKVKQLFTALSQQKEELHTVIASMQECLVLIDRDGRLSICNTSFSRLVNRSPGAGRYYWEIFYDSAIRDVIAGVQQNKNNYAGELVWRDRSFLCSATVLPSTDSVLLILHDITELRGFEKLKRDFVGNVSHELRTPLTAIKGFVETIIEDAQGETRHYLEIIKRHTNRLISIVEDLLMLSALEDRGAHLEIGDVDLKLMVQNILLIFAQQVQDKNLQVQIDVQGEETVIQADAYKLEQMFINLIQNAVTYTEKGSITIGLIPATDHLRIRVQDTGIGIPPVHLPRIFERFYVSDKSRSRKLGGTGLGLAIVKHIVLLHRGTIGVESTPGQGTVFTIDLPRFQPQPDADKNTGYPTSILSSPA